MDDPFIREHIEGNSMMMAVRPMNYRCYCIL